MWLTVLPIETHGFVLSKSEFGDIFCLQYGWRPPYLPDTCTCYHIFTINHAMSCSKGGFSTIRLNELRDVLAGMMSDVCCDVHTEPTLQPLNGEVLPKQTTILGMTNHAWTFLLVVSIKVSKKSALTCVFSILLESQYYDI